MCDEIAYHDSFSVVDIAVIFAFIGVKCANSVNSFAPVFIPVIDLRRVTLLYSWPHVLLSGVDRDDGGFDVKPLIEPAVKIVNLAITIIIIKTVRY